MADDEGRRFVFAPEMAKLKAAIEGKMGEAQKLAEETDEKCAELIEQLHDSNDLMERLVYMVTGVRDYGREIIDADELQKRADHVLEGVGLDDGVAQLVEPLRRPQR